MTLEISYQNKTIYKTEFYQSVIIPNIIFEGIKTPIYNNDIPFGKKKDKKNEPLIPKDYGNDNIPYSIMCFADSPQIPIVKDPFTTNKNNTKYDTLEWSIRFFSTDSLVISKNMCKETKEKSLRELWEKEPTRSLKAKNSRFNYLIENKINRIIPNTTKNFNPKDGFKINLKSDLNLNPEELKFLDYFKQAEGSKDKIINLQTDDIGINNANSQYAPSVFSDKEKDKEKDKERDKERDKEKENKLSEYRKLGKSNRDNETDKDNEKETSEKNEGNANNDIRDPVRDYEDNLNFYKNYKYIQYTQNNWGNFYSPEKTKSKLIGNFLNYAEEDRMKIIKNNIVTKSDKYNTKSKTNIYIY